MFGCFSIHLCLWFWIMLVAEAAPGQIFPYVPEDGSCRDSTTEYLSDGVCCRRCAPGQFASHKCTATSDTHCSSCPENTFTELYNYASNCRLCRPCEAGLVELSPCTKTKGSVCVCPENSICLGVPPLECESCEDHNPCQPGTYTLQIGDLGQHPKCSPCPTGFFNDRPSVIAHCYRHNNCTELEMVLAKPGTSESNAVCKDPMVDKDTGWLGFVILLAVVVMLVIIGAIAGPLCCLIRKQQHSDKDHTPGSGKDSEQSSLLSPSGSVISSNSSIPQFPAPSAGSPPPPIAVPHSLTALQGAEHETHSRTFIGLQGGREAGQQQRLCQLPFTGEMKVNGNVYIYNGPVVNQASPTSDQRRDPSPPPSSDQHSDPSPPPSSSPPVSQFRLPVQEEQSVVPVQEQQGTPLQESGKEFHITIEETNSY
ncbi:tumor necrosis factor receptor superfamily member 3-like [Acipenser oxyrinchus oxyrinchus]|uniref:Tumor necrosis factor receptor superfamily member 3-like n=1 Tax=Acipenser oxyrinchus oxyrinchus TaxID=40147 RepID=A0AAD8D8W1_ACIOX|nr:tumor necrosis factor receptor superfamily member 3-like [Acipenser oxyrinchus oxyrinchus]